MRLEREQVCEHVLGAWIALICLGLCQLLCLNFGKLALVGHALLEDRLRQASKCAMRSCRYTLCKGSV